jgi:hypothetical protein
VKSVCFHVWVPLNGQLPHLLYWRRTNMSVRYQIFGS